MTQIDINDIGFIMGLFGLVGVIFGIYKYFKDPQVKTEQNDVLLGLEIKQLKEDILSLKEIITNLKDNHIHSLQVAIENTNNNLNALTIQVAKLGTVVEERLPKK